MATLKQLIADHRGDRTLVHLQADGGGAPSDQQWGSFAKGEPLTRFPKPDTIRAIARALNVPLETVILAAGETVGLKPEQQSELSDQLARQLPASSGQLLPDQVLAIRVTVIAFSEANRRALRD